MFISDPRHTQSVTKSNRGKVDVIHICNHENNVRALPVITTMALWQLMHLSTWCTCTNYHKCHWEGLLLSWLTIYKYIFLYTYMYIYIHILYAYIYIYIYIHIMQLLFFHFQCLFFILVLPFLSPHSRINVYIWYLMS